MLAFSVAALAAAAQPSIAPPSQSPAVSPEAQSTSSSPLLEASAPWWEKVTVTVDDKGKQHSCRYEASFSPAGAKACDEAMAASVSAGARGPNGQFSKVTFERRFSPGSQLDDGTLQPGDELLARQVLFLTFNADGSVTSCKQVAATGEMKLAYDCEAAKSEKFRAQASAGPGGRQAFMTVLAYGHSENLA